MKIMIRKRVPSLVAVICFMIVISFCTEVFAAETSSTSHQDQQMNLNLIGPVQVPGEQEIKNDVRSSPYLPAIPHNEMPAYFGPFNKEGNWNDQSKSILPFILMDGRNFEITEGFWEQRLAKREINFISKKKHPPVKHLIVLNGISELNSMKFDLLASIVTYGGRKTTTIDCFLQAIYETGEIGGNVFLLLKSASNPGIHSSTIGLGGSSAGNFSQGGQDAYSGGMALGFSSNTGSPISSPFVHGVALLISSQELKKFKNLTLPDLNASEGQVQTLHKKDEEYEGSK